METIYKVKTISVKLKVSDVERKEVRGPEEVFDVCRVVYEGLDADQEHFTILTLNKANRVTGYKVVHSGGQDQALVDMKVVFRNALLMGATAIVLVHNHPSGNTAASREDIDITRKLQKAGETLGIVVLDHMILSGDSYLSMREHGIIN